mmetsp:Transcript_81671/g.231227  ORF Transcript_81671/g.231227 Transcript_81671/m.231227 type:complete len:89 (+) Transcript_81671:2-268(+)
MGNVQVLRATIRQGELAGLDFVDRAVMTSARQALAALEAAAEAAEAAEASTPAPTPMPLEQISLEEKFNMLQAASLGQVSSESGAVGI